MSTPKQIIEEQFSSVQYTKEGKTAKPGHDTTKIIQNLTKASANWAPEFKTHIVNELYIKAKMGKDAQGHAPLFSAASIAGTCYNLLAVEWNIRIDRVQLDQIVAKAPHTLLQSQFQPIENAGETPNPAKKTREIIENITTASTGWSQECKTQIINELYIKARMGKDAQDNTSPSSAASIARTCYLLLANDWNIRIDYKQLNQEVAAQNNILKPNNDDSNNNPSKITRPKTYGFGTSSQGLFAPKNNQTSTPEQTIRSGEETSLRRTV